MDSLYALEDPWHSADLRPVFEPFLREALELRPQAVLSAPVLDAGGGEGWYRKSFDPAGEYHLLDIAPAALERARKTITDGRCRFIAASLDSFKPSRNFYGAILLNSILTYLGRERYPRIYRSTLRRLGDSLMPGGVIVLIHPFYTPDERERILELGAPFLEQPGFRRIPPKIREGRPQSFVCEIYQRIAK